MKSKIHENLIQINKEVSKTKGKKSFIITPIQRETKLTNNIGGPAMNTHAKLFGIALLFLGACTSSYKTTNSGSSDDIYFSTKDVNSYENEAQTTDGAEPSNGEYRTVYDEPSTGSQQKNAAPEPDYVETESYTDETGDTYITNNYYEDNSSDYEYDDYYDYSYASRLRRFYQPTYSYGYYDTYYTNSYWYSYNPYDYGVSIYLGYPWWGYNNYAGWGYYGNNWGYNNHHHHHGWANYYHHHHSYGGYYGQYGYGYGNGYGYGYGSGYGYGYGDGYGYGYGGNTGYNSFYYNSYDVTNTYYGPRYATTSNSAAVTHTSLAESYEKEYGKGNSLVSHMETAQEISPAHVNQGLTTAPGNSGHSIGNASNVSTTSKPMNNATMPLVNSKGTAGLDHKAPVKSKPVKSEPVKNTNTYVKSNTHGNVKSGTYGVTKGVKGNDKGSVSHSGYNYNSNKPVKVVRPKEHVQPSSTKSGNGYSSKPATKPTRNSSQSYNKPNNGYSQKGKTYSNRNSSYTKPRSNSNSHSNYSKPKSTGTSRPNYSKPNSSYSRPKQSTSQPRSSTPRTSTQRSSTPRTSTQRSSAPRSSTQRSSSPSRSSSPKSRTSTPKTSRPR